MLSLEMFEKQVQALMEALLEAARTELRRILLSGSWSSGVSALQRSAAGEGERAVALITDQFFSLMKVCTKDVPEKTAMMVRMSVCETRPGLSTNPEVDHRKKLAACRRRFKRELQSAVTNLSGHISCKEEQQTEVLSEAAAESEINPASCEEVTSEPSPAPDAVSLDHPPAPDPDDGEENFKQTNVSKKKAGSIQCTSCDKTFTQKCLMERHNQSHTKPHTCSHCGKCFATLRDLIPHTRKHTGEKVYSCPDCGIRFAYKSTFDRHMRSHTLKKMEIFMHTCPLCENQFTSMSMFQRHMCSALQRTFVCSVCPETFECRKGLADHEVLHSENKDFICEMCGERFLSSSSLATHRVTHLQEENSYDDSINHGRKKLFSCPICGKELSHQSALKHHMLKHTGQKDHICETCGKRCGHASALQNHKRVHTGKKRGERPACDECGKTFTSASRLKRHTIIHTENKPYTCSHCGKEFNNPSNLKAHALTHRSTKMFGCNVCGRRFAQSAGLKQHRQLHVGKFKCKVCGKGFTLKHKLLKHERQHRSGGTGGGGSAEETDQIQNQSNL
ncbi:oocyte zinc finger protein XlCOF6-like [Cyprinodon tularosa]|uniref:oocyte zinc finger protein XlCOF6-like n=1 Tax=Cyprinodon tularosa TaxID=77115 RepID=UPI0018E2662E|nr:oocyte zinc finger protein XlCOF6-like [Cyprinodon tularosa]